MVRRILSCGLAPTPEVIKLQPVVTGQAPMMRTKGDKMLAAEFIPPKKKTAQAGVAGVFLAW
jgi:hypothetical protein